MKALALSNFVLFCLFVVFARWYYVCQVKQICGSPPVEEAPQDVRLRTLQLREDGEVLLDSYDQFAFNAGTISPRLNDDNIAFLDTVAALLAASPDKHLTITAQYHDSEKDAKSGFFENPGLARADAVRRLLVQRGIDEARMTPDYATTPDSLLREPVSFTLYTRDAIPDDYDRVAFTFTNMTFSDANFAFGSDEFQPGEAFLLYADSVRLYLANNPTKNLTIVGHTDDVGDHKFNDRLGLRRAESAKRFFEAAGVTVQIQTDSKGKRQPAAPNDTPEGRQRNRRVNFILE